MDFNATVDLIIRELDEAREIIDDLKNYPGVPALQVELAKSKCRNVAGVIVLLKNLQDKSSGEKSEPVIQAPRQKEVTEERIPESKKYEKSERKSEVRSQAPVTAKEEPVKTIKKASESVIIADTFSQRTDSLNEQLGSHKEEDGVGGMIKAKPITNLSEAIGINDKFLFIRELFNGNHELYKKTISSLDNSGSFADALAVIMSYSGNDTENEAAKQLIDLVKRKFPANE